MARTIRQVLAILLVTSAVGLLSNAVRSDGIQLGKDRPQPTPTTTTSTSTQPFSDPNVATLDEVVQHFRASDARFIDARKPEEFAAGHIKGAINLPSTSVYQDIQKVLNYVIPDEQVIVYCGGGECEASHTVADVLKGYAFKHVKVYSKGWEELERSPNLAELTTTGPE